MRRSLLFLTPLAVAGCSSAPIQIDAGNRSTAAVSVMRAESERIAFQLSAPSYVAAVEVVYGGQLSALAPRDSSGALDSGEHALAFRVVAATIPPDPAASLSGTRVDDNPVRVVDNVVYEPCPGEPPVRYESVPIDPGNSTERVMVRQETRYCRAPASRQVSGGRAPSPRWVVLLASDHPIDVEQVAANLATLRSTGFAPDLLANVAAVAMAGHEGTWSAAAARQ